MLWPGWAVKNCCVHSQFGQQTGCGGKIQVILNSLQTIVLSGVKLTGSSASIGISLWGGADGQNCPIVQIKLYIMQKMNIFTRENIFL